MWTPDVLLIIFIIVGALARASVVTVAASLLLALRMLNLHRFLPMIERRSLELGLLFLMIALLAPIAGGRLSSRDVGETLFSTAGLVTVFGGIIATVINGRGLDMLQESPSLLVCVLIGSVIGIVAFRGMPVGPLMATAIAALLLRVISLFR